MQTGIRRFVAMIWTSDAKRPGQRVEVEAADLQEARTKLEAEYGEGNVCNLHNEDDSLRRRQN
jgi:hypothetical protein